LEWLTGAIEAVNLVTNACDMPSLFAASPRFEKLLVGCLKALHR
jgi:hypothetical protein